MKIKIYFIALLLISKAASAQVPTNLGFENWTVDTLGRLDPDGWKSSNLSNLPSASVERIAGRTGYALRLKKISAPGSFLNVAGGFLRYESPVVNYKSIELKGYWRGSFNSGNDNIRTEVIYYDSAGNYLTTIYQSTGTTASISAWTPFSQTIYGNNGKNWNYILSLKYSYGNNALGNMYGDFDDLTMDIVTSTGELISIDLMHNFSLVTKQPLKEYALKMDLLAPSELNIDLIDVQGKIVNSSKKEFDAGHFEYPIDMSGIANGFYICRIQSGNISRQFKLIRNSN